MSFSQVAVNLGNTYYYNLLGIDPKCNQDEIKTAYKKISLRHHPDKGGNTKKFQEIQEAYLVLSDPVKRKDYDLCKEKDGNKDIDEMIDKDLMMFFNRKKKKMQKKKERKSSPEYRSYINYIKTLSIDPAVDIFDQYYGQHVDNMFKIIQNKVQGEVLPFYENGDLWSFKQLIMESHSDLMWECNQEGESRIKDLFMGKEESEPELSEYHE